MELKEALARLHKSRIFSDWMAKNHGAYLSHGFMMFEKGHPSTWEIGYCTPKDNAITVFEMKDEISMRESEKPFQKESSKVPPLDEKRIRSTLSDALMEVDRIQKEKYAAHKPMKILALAQTLPVGQCWNISYITGSFKILNVKMDMETKKILDEKIVSIVADMQ